jgi:hypothetical protein
MEQRDLFGPAPAPTLPEARAAGVRGMAEVAANAEEASPGFAELAREFILAFLAGSPPTSAEDLSDACLAAGIRPHDLRAFGPVVQGLARAGKIKKAGSCPRRRGHGTAGGNLWALAGGGQGASQAQPCGGTVHDRRQ